MNSLATKHSIRAVLCSLALLPMAAQAAAPNAGDLLRQAPQNPAATTRATPLQVLPREQAESQGLAVPAAVKVTIRKIKLTGVTSFAADRTDALTADAIGKELDFGQIQALADRITTFYRSQGFVAARAWLPAQRIENGMVEIAVLEGRLGRINIDAAAPLDAERLRPYLAALVPGQPLRSQALEEGLLRLSDLPGVRVQSVLRPGQAVGTTDLDIQVQTGQSTSGNVALDNYGNRYTGRTRLSGRLNLASTWRTGDSIDFNVATSGSGMNYGRAAWQTPVGSGGTQVGLAGSALRYRLGKQFTTAESSGNATDLTLYALTSLVRSRAASAQAQVALDIKRFDDLASGLRSNKRAQVLALGVSGYRQESFGGFSQGSLTLGLGRLQLDSGAAAGDVYRTGGSYAKLSGSFEHQRLFDGGLAASLRVAAQLAGKNLDSSEKFGLGGPQGVRAYGGGTASSDDALLVSAELSRELWGVRAKVFGDIGLGRIAHKPLTATATTPGDIHNTRHLYALGVGADASLPAGLQLQAAAAVPLGGDDSLNERGPRLWLQLSRNF
ncbi:MAG: ShlB/FhaC/HecB family hemolysin secretion/activation protein [Burkholderiales bacterium]|nr:ShlB/FhaC/HecB family hemolysin secretion/activation protein [Burkholderiales bacterium]